MADSRPKFEDVRWHGRCMKATTGRAGEIEDVEVISFTVGIMKLRLCRHHANELGQDLIDVADAANPEN